MNMKLKRMLSMLLVLAMVLTLVGPATASASAYTSRYDENVQLQVGERILLQAPLWYFRTTWSSSDETVATVSQHGILTGVKAGEAVITAKSGKLLGFIGLERTTTYHVTVTEAMETVELHIGDQVRLTAPTEGGKTLWTSSNRRVAKVSKDGTVTALREGEATITASVMKRSGWNRLRWYKALEVKYHIIVTCVPAEPPVVTYTVIFNSNGGSEVESQIVEEGMTAAEPAAPTLEGYTFTGWYTDAELTAAYDFEAPVTGDLTLYAGWEEIDLSLIDSDGDGLFDAEEDHYLTDRYNPDTDGDGFNDFAEVYLMGTDPLVADDVAADTDADGLTDGDEVNVYNTDINSADTDKDGLTDYDEVHVYHTDPTLADSDNDGLSDSFELEHGFDPNAESSDGENKDGDVPVEQELADEGISNALKEESNIAVPSIRGEAAGEMKDHVFLATSGDSAFEDNRAVVGMPIYVDGDDTYLSGLTLEFDVSAYEGNVEELTICTINKDGVFEPVESTIDGDVISCTLAGSGTYFVMNVDEFLAGLGMDMEGNVSPQAAEAMVMFSGVAMTAAADVKGQADIVFAIDTTGSMYDAIDNVINNVAKFATTLSENYNVQINYGLIDFKDLEEDGAGTTVIVKNGSSEWFSNTSDFISKLNTLVATGGGDYEECDVDALETARRMSWRASANKFIILITDADYKVANDYGIASMEEEIALLAADGINTSVVTTTSEQSRYQSLYETTGGIFANIYDDFSSVLMSLADLIGNKTSDGAWVILKHGYRYVKLPELPAADSTADTDDDGYTDYYELGELETIELDAWVKLWLIIRGVPEEEYTGATTITVYDAHSDPTKADTDYDGIMDKEDTAPWTKGLEDGIVGAIKICSYGTGPNSSGNFSGHAFVAYTSFVIDEIELYGIKVNSFDERAKEDDTRTDTFSYHTMALTTNEVLTIGGWAGWLPESLKGTWINNELVLYENSGVPSDQRSLTEYITVSQVEKMCNLSYTCCKWTELYNCSALATDVWNGVTGDDLSARGALYFRNPASLSHNIEERDGFEIGDSLLVEWP